MRRAILTTLLTAAFCAGIYVARPGLAQDPAKDDLRYQVTASLSKLVDAANRGDSTTVMTIFSKKPGVTVIADGEVYQGTDDIQPQTERLLGQRGRYLFQLGTMSISDLHGMALATGPYTLRPRDGGSSQTYRGAVSFLMEREGRKKWVVAHLHRSTAATKAQLD